MIRQLPVDMQKVLKSLEEEELPPGRKYKKLSHLNQAEKGLRRKLMNKTNSKISRARKKKEVEILEDSLRNVIAGNNKLKVMIMYRPF